MTNASYYAEHREDLIAKALKWQNDNHDRYLVRLHNWRAKLKKEAMVAYGNENGLCVECLSVEATELHHPNMDGEDHRARSIGPRIGGSNFYRYLKKLNWPGDMIAVCRYCHDQLDHKIKSLQRAS